jgi:hypothetical protein
MTIAVLALSGVLAFQLGNRNGVIEGVNSHELSTT